MNEPNNRTSTPQPSLRFAKSTEGLSASEIRDLMSLATAPNIISFAGGMPGNDLFPLEEMDEIYNNLTDREKQIALQYGPTSGLPSLLESLASYLEKKGMRMEGNRLMVTTGSLQAIHILARAFIDPGDKILVENPSFIGALSAFRACEAELKSIPLREAGMDLSLLADALSNETPLPKLLYFSPNFHNPAGINYSPEVKRGMIELLRGKNIPVIEDDVYSDIWFHEADMPGMKNLKAMNHEGIDVCFTGSFSKILGPGLRLGWMLVPEAIYRKCELIKQSMDACSPSISQVIADRFIRTGAMYTYIERIRKEYKKRGEAMISALEKYLPEYVSFVRPRGGFYTWLQLPKGTDSTLILKKAIDKGVVFVTGKTFDPASKRNNFMRVSFCNTDEKAIERGVPLIAEAIKEVCG